MRSHLPPGVTPRMIDEAMGIDDPSANCECGDLDAEVACIEEECIAYGLCDPCALEDYLYDWRREHTCDWCQRRERDQYEADRYEAWSEDR